MDFNTLRNNLQLPYSQNNWKEWLLFIFGQQISIETQTEKIQIQKGNAKSIVRFASIALSDERNIAVLDIKTTKDVQIARNRVALRDIAFNLIDQDKYHGTLVFYHSEDDNQLDYRLSFISKQTTIDEDGNFTTQSTNAKRYSFILGDNESCYTATKNLLELKNKVPAFKAFETQKGITLKDLTDTFSVEALNNEFFKKYKDIHYKRFWEYIANHNDYSVLLLNNDEIELVKKQKPIRDFVKKMLGRIVFLHFLQKKGWMGCPADIIEWKGGDKNFMLNLFTNHSNQNEFYGKCLTILFFQILNTDRRKKNDVIPKSLHYTNPNSIAKEFRAPFLNGGLFDDDQPQTNNFNFPVEYFKDLFDFFSQYNFTIDENSPEEQEVGIDPEMLGHIFENLLEENKDKGAFYTPKEIVHYMCQESLIQYLRTHLPECTENESQATKAIETFIRKDDIGNRTDKKNFIVANAKRIEAILDKVKICDPAIGSGAFPMGMLQEIFKAKTTLDLTLDKVEVKKNIIQHSIYGVDIEKGAVDIARLRFWLSLVVDEDEPQPLPNLDYKIMQGNSLLESFEDVDLSNLLDENKDEPIIYAQHEQVQLFAKEKQTLMVFDKTTKEELQNLIDLHFDFEENNNNTYKTKKEIKQAINTIIEGKLKAHFYIEKKKYERQKAEMQTLQNSNTINANDPNGIIEKKKKAVENLNIAIENIDYKINHLTSLLTKLSRWEKDDKERPYFLWHTYFKDVFENGGFDIVIGNPPYVGQKGHKELFQQILNSDFGRKYHQRRMDLFYFFFHNGIINLKKEGILTFITTNYYLTATYADKLRKHIYEETSILALANFNELKIFETAQGQHNLITILKKGKNSDINAKTFITQKKGIANEEIIHTVVSGNDNETEYNLQKQNSLFESNTNYIRIETTNSNNTSGGIYSILNKMKNNNQLLDEFCFIEQGIVSGADKVSESHIKEYSKYNFKKGEGIYILTNKEVEKFNFNNEENKLLKKTYKNSEISKWIVKYKNDLNVIYIKSTGNYYEPPLNIKNHLDRFKIILINRNVRVGKITEIDYEDFLNNKKEISYIMNATSMKKGNYYSLSYARRSIETFEVPKIVNSRRSKSNIFAYENNGYYEQSDIVITTLKHKYKNVIDLKFFLGVLNSRLIYQWFYFKGKRKGDYLELFQKPISEVPIKFDKNEINENIVELTNKIIELTKSNNKTDFYINKVDALVFHLYELNESEMNQVLDMFPNLDTINRTQIENEYKNITNNKFRLEL